MQIAEVTRKNQVVSMDIRDRFKALRHSLNISQSEMSDLVGLSKNAWQSYELGKSTPGTYVYVSLQKLGFSVDWILSGNGPMHVCSADFSDYSFLPLFKSVEDRDCGTQSSEWVAFKTCWLTALNVPPSNLAIVSADGDSMIPTVFPGDLLMVDISRRYICGDGLYMLNFCDQAIVERIQVELDGSVKLLSDNPLYPARHVTGDALRDLLILGRVVWHGHRV